MHHNIELRKEPGIYIFTNKVNGKKYVGESINIRNRFKCYIYPQPDRPITRALIKYGIEEFDIKVIYFPRITKNELLDLEETFIFLESSLIGEHGYNICERGQGRTGFITSDDTKLKISNSNRGKFVGDKNPMYGKTGDKNPMYGKNHSEETRKIMKQNGSKKTGDKNPMYGKNHSEETRKKISETKRRNFQRKLLINL